MKEVILTVGPQGSGKSDFCEKVVALDPSVILISRDKILIELFGSVFLDSYSGGHSYAHEVMWERVQKQIQISSVSKIILDTWNGTSRERDEITQQLRSLGAERIVAWYFTTPAEIVNEWFWKKPQVAKFSEIRSRQGQNLTFFSEDAPTRDHALFHKWASGIDSEPFDKVVRINPLIITPERAFGLQTGLKS